MNLFSPEAEKHSTASPSFPSVFVVLLLLGTGHLNRKWIFASFINLELHSKRKKKNKRSKKKGREDKKDVFSFLFLFFFGKRSKSFKVGSVKRRNAVTPERQSTATAWLPLHREAWRQSGRGHLLNRWLHLSIKAIIANSLWWRSAATVCQFLSEPTSSHKL